MDTNPSPSSAAKVLPEGTLLVAMYGATIGQVGRLRIAAAPNQACAALIPGTDGVVNRNFLFHLLISLRPSLKRMGQGGAQPNISQLVLRSVPVPVAPPSEQAVLAVALDSSLKRVAVVAAEFGEQIGNLATLDRAVLSKAFRGELVPQDPNDEPAEVMLARVWGPT